MEYKHTAQEIDTDGKEFLKTLSPKELDRHNLAQKMLGSSYFVDKTPQFKEWKLTKASTLTSQPRATK